MTEQQRAELDLRVIEAGRQGFQYRYESIRVPDEDAERLRQDSLLDRFVRFMSSREVLDFLSNIPVTPCRNLPTVRRQLIRRAISSPATTTMLRAKADMLPMCSVLRLYGGRNGAGC